MLETEKHFILPIDHPYIDGMGLTVYERSPGNWVVKWRDFLTMMQDCEFNDEEKARHYRDEILLRARFVSRNLLDDACTSFKEASSFWESLSEVTP